MNKFFKPLMLRKEAGVFDRFKKDDDSNKLARVAVQTAAAPLGFVGMKNILTDIDTGGLDRYVSSLKTQQTALSDKLRALTKSDFVYKPEFTDDIIFNNHKINRLSRAYRRTARRLSLADPTDRKYVGRNIAAGGLLVGAPLAAAWLAGKGYDKAKATIKATKDDGIF